MRCCPSTASLPTRCWTVANTAVVSLVAGGALAAGSASWCIGSLAATLVLLCAQLCVCVAFMPFITFFFHLHSVVTQVLTILSTGLALGAAVANSRTPQDLDSISTLSSASAVVSLLAVGVVATRMMIDLRSIVVALLRIAQRLRRGAPRAALEKVAHCLPSANNDAPATLPLEGDDVLAWNDFFDDLPDICYDGDVTTVNDGDVTTLWTTAPFGTLTATTSRSMLMATSSLRMMVVSAR
jgi:hypothetical protein